MSARTLSTLVALLGALSACDDASPPPPVARPDVPSANDASSDALADVAPADATRTLVRRGVLAASVDSLLLDPLVTGDDSWGHFYGVAFDGSRLTTYPISRSLWSDTPASVSAPVVLVSDAPLGDEPEVRLMAFVPGSSTAVTATIWVSVRDDGGAEVPFASRAAGLRVALMANAGLPESATMQTTTQSLLEPDARTTQRRRGREWVRLSLPSPVALTQGGYFSIKVTDFTSQWRFTAPDVVVDASSHLGVRRPPRALPLDDRDRAAIRAYASHADEVATARGALPPRSDARDAARHR